ncbi:MAG: M23 family metallopeptidase [Lysobacter sp.]|nr:M23 family metallopeptidase [Lysobacter sp.]MDQ3269358.1 M23 family metallopeptidase [Pseudomonadota bacterium]
MEPAPRRAHDYAPAARSLAVTTLVLGVLATLAYWAWHQPFMIYPRTLWEIGRMPPPASLPVPVEGVPVEQVADSWGAARGPSRSHEGIDIFAPRGTPVLSTTRGVVSSVRESGLGGKQVWVLGPGMERHYYAHLDDWAAGLSERQVVRAGDTLGYVGTSGNARGTPPHLHYGIYGSSGAMDPLPRLRANGPPPES